MHMWTLSSVAQSSGATNLPTMMTCTAQVCITGKAGQEVPVAQKKAVKKVVKKSKTSAPSKKTTKATKQRGTTQSGKPAGSSRRVTRSSPADRSPKVKARKVYVLVKPEPKGIKHFDTRFGMMLFIGKPVNPEMVSKVWRYASPRDAAVHATKRFGEGPWSVLECELKGDTLVPRKIVATFNSHTKDKAYKTLIAGR